MTTTINDIIDAFADMPARDLAVFAVEPDAPMSIGTVRGNLDNLCEFDGLTRDGISVALDWLQSIYHRADAVSALMGVNGIGPKAHELRGMVGDLIDNVRELAASIERETIPPGYYSARDMHSLITTGFFLDGSEA